MNRICIFCGATPGVDPAFVDAATQVAQAAVAVGLGLVTGGGSVGLMGAVADAALAAGGEVIGVIPQALVDREVAHPGLTSLRVVPTMHERKRVMHDLSDGFVALAGGLGTLEELFETLTWAQLGIHRKPIWLLNTRGYYDPLLALVEAASDEGFVRPEHRGLLLVQTDPAALVVGLTDYRPPALPKVMDSEET